MRRRVAVSRVLEDGEHFGKYQVVRWIARGGMSEVYEAVHTALRKPVALKVLRGDLADNEEAVERFSLEGNNAALVRHPNVVDVSDVGEVDGLPYLVMELLEGDSLGELLTRIGRMPVAEAVDLLLPVIAAVSGAHEHGVIHRDLKPDNIFLQYEGSRIVPKVLDFGASRVMHLGRVTINASVIGTPHYMSPEQARGESGTDARSDQHSLAVMLYEAVIGVLPRDAADPLELLHQVAYGPFRRPSEHMELPEGLEAVIVRAMAREPSQRYATTREFGLALLPYASPSSRDYWAVELRYPSARKTADISQPSVSSRRFTPSKNPPPSAPDASDGGPVLIPISEVPTRMLPSSRPPPALPHPKAAESVAEAPFARRSPKKGLIIAGALIAAVAAGVWLAQGNSGAAHAPAAAPTTPVAASPAAAAPEPAAEPETSASATEASPEASATSRAASARRASAAPAKKAALPPAAKTVAPAPEPAPVRAISTGEPSPKVRVIEDSKPKVQVIE